MSTPSLAAQGVDPVAHFLSKVDVGGPSDCWPFAAAIQANGYGHYFWNGWQGNAHRWAYQLFVGEPPARVPLDHTCHTAAVIAGECTGGPTCSHRRCVNPRHLELVTVKVNSERGYQATKDRCHRGHLLTEDNVCFTAGRRHCRACRAVNYRIRENRKRAEAIARGEWRPWEPVTHCVHGHPYSGDNLRIIATTGRRVCRSCELDRSRAYKARQRSRRKARSAPVERAA